MMRRRLDVVILHSGKRNNNSMMSIPTFTAIQLLYLSIEIKV